MLDLLGVLFFTPYAVYMLRGLVHEARAFDAAIKEGRQPPAFHPYAWVFAIAWGAVVVYGAFACWRSLLS